MKKQIFQSLFSIVTMLVCEALAVVIFFGVDWRIGAAYLLTHIGAACGKEGISGLVTGLGIGEMMAKVREHELSLPIIAICPHCKGLKHHRDCEKCVSCGSKLLLTRDYPSVTKSEDFK